MDLNTEIDVLIGKNVPWSQFPSKIKEVFGNSIKSYEKYVCSYSIKNQLRFSENLIKNIRKDERRYYEEVIAYSKERLMLYPYHLADRVVKGLRITPFQYYSSVMEQIMDQEKSYDALPNFTAADCLRLLGIGRNQYIELMNQHRSSRKLFRKKIPARDLLPTKPIDILIEPWFYVEVGCLTEDDMNQAKVGEKKIIDFVIDNGIQRAGSLDYECVHSLYRKGLIYLDVPIDGEDYIVVPPLEGFVMNRVLGDYFETLLYKIFVSIDEHTKVDELASILDIDSKLIRNAVSLYCRLGFAYKKNLDSDAHISDPSWKKWQMGFGNKSRGVTTLDETLLVAELSSALKESDSISSLHDILPLSPSSTSNSAAMMGSDTVSLSSSTSAFGINHFTKRIAFLYDSTITAFLMMGNLSPGLKNHAVTMFEVGKMTDESLDSFLLELEQVSCNDGEGEAQRYFEHAKTLKKTILFLRNNPLLGSMTLDLLRCESLLNLDNSTLSRLLNKNYAMLVSMAPLSGEVKPIFAENIPHFGPPIAQINSVWFKLWLYSITGAGPKTLLLSRGTILTELPEEMEECAKYLVTSWGHDSGVIPGSNALFTLNDALTHSAILVQEFGTLAESATVIIPFPLTENPSSSSTKKNSSPPRFSSSCSSTFLRWAKHPAIVKLSEAIDLESTCGYITMMNLRGSAHIPATFNSDVKNDVNEDGVTSFSMDESAPSRLEKDDPRSPQNGFKDEGCVALYEQELDSCINSSSETMNGTQDGNELKSVPVYDSRQQKIETLRLALTETTTPITSDLKVPSTMSLATTDNDENTSSSNSWYNNWTLLDCHFGLPLFDASINGIVAERIITNNLLEDASLDRLVNSNKKLAAKLIDFIKEHQVPSKWDEAETPLPSHNFYCVNGIIQQLK